MVREHLVRLEPDPHRVLLEPRMSRVADALDALELGEHVDVGEVVEELLVVLRFELLMFRNISIAFSSLAILTPFLTPPPAARPSPSSRGSVR